MNWGFLRISPPVVLLPRIYEICQTLADFADSPGRFEIREIGD